MPRVTVDVPLAEAPRLLLRIAVGLTGLQVMSLRKVMCRITLVSDHFTAGRILQTLRDMGQPAATYYSDTDSLQPGASHGD